MALIGLRNGFSYDVAQFILTLLYDFFVTEAAAVLYFLPLVCIDQYYVHW